MAILALHNSGAVGVVVGLDRKEKGNSGKSAIQEVADEFGISVISIVDIDDIRQYLAESGFDSELLARIDQYREQYGV